MKKNTTTFLSLEYYNAATVSTNRAIVKRTWSVQKVPRILNFRGLRLLDFQFFMALFWYSLMPTSSAISNVQLIFDSYFAWTCVGSYSIFASSVSGTRKSHGGQIWGIRWLRQYYCVVFSQKFAHKQRGRYRDAKANVCSSTNPGVSGGLLRANWA